MPNNDLISRKELFEQIEEVEKAMRPTLTDYVSEKALDCMISGAKIILKHALAVDAEPVRHGQWEIELDETSDCEFMRCSICSEVFYDGENDTVDTLPNYCPNCGAKMDKKE